MTYFIRNGNNFNVAAENSVDIRPKLPVGNYIIKQDPYENLYLQLVDDFKPIKKTYGSIVKDTQRIISTYHDRDTSTGVLLTGEKGSGKTLLAKNLSIALAAEDIPTIIINNAWTGDKFNKFLQDIEQECMILFDEFEKVYDSENQEVILTLLDGVFPSRKLFVLTCNDKWRIDSHMRNRPGRIFYMLDFSGLEVEFIIEYCQDNLKNQSYIQKVCDIAYLFSQFNFDMLKALVEEMNRYDECPKDAMRMLNAKPEFGDSSEYSVNIVKAGTKIALADLRPSVVGCNPMNSEDIDLHYIDKTNDDDWTNVELHQADLVTILPKEGRYIYQKDDYSVTLTRIHKPTFNFDAF